MTLRAVSTRFRSREEREAYAQKKAAAKQTGKCMHNSREECKRDYSCTIGYRCVSTISPELKEILELD